MQTLKSLKAQATKREIRRVYDNMCLPPRDIAVEFGGKTHVRRAYTSGRFFGWSRWEAVR